MTKLAVTLLMIFVVSCGSKSTPTATTTNTTTTSTDNTGNNTSETVDETIYTVSNYSVSIIASPSATVNVGATISLSATVVGISDPIFDFTYVSGNIQALTASQNGNLASVSSNVANSVVIGVTVTSNSNRSIQAYNQIALQFGSGSSTTTTNTTTSVLNCTLTHDTSNTRPYSTIFFYLTSDTGEQLRLVSWEPGEGWDRMPPSFPINLQRYNSINYFYGYYSYGGVKNVRIVAESVSRPGVYCNGGAPLTDTVTLGY